MNSWLRSGWRGGSFSLTDTEVFTLIYLVGTEVDPESYKDGAVKNLVVKCRNRWISGR